MKALMALLLAVSLVGPGVSAAADVTVAVVDVAQLQREVPQIATLREKIAEAFAAREAALAEQQALIKRLEAKLNEPGTELTATESKSLQRDIRSRTLRLENAKEELESDRRLRLNEEMDRVRRVLSEVIAEVATAEELDVVLESGVTWASARANITDRVLERMRELDAASQ